MALPSLSPPPGIRVCTVGVLPARHRIQQVLNTTLETCHVESEVATQGHESESSGQMRKRGFLAGCPSGREVPDSGGM